MKGSIIYSEFIFGPIFPNHHPLPPHAVVVVMAFLRAYRKFATEHAHNFPFGHFVTRKSLYGDPVKSGRRREIFFLKVIPN